MIDDDNISRFKSSKELAFLEKNIFRAGSRHYNGQVNDIALYAGTTPKDELQYITGKILELTRLSGYRYSDIAVVQVILVCMESLPLIYFPRMKYHFS